LQSCQSVYLKFTEEAMKLTQMFPKRYASGEDFQGKALTLTVARVEREKMFQPKNASETEKWVVYFQEAKKGVVLNRTLAFQIAEILGSEETEDWVGAMITLYPQPMTVAGRKVVAIRARAAGKAIADGSPALLDGDEVNYG
jgi:hypothetical protein